MGRDKTKIENHFTECKDYRSSNNLRKLNALFNHKELLSIQDRLKVGERIKELVVEGGPKQFEVNPNLLLDTNQEISDFVLGLVDNNFMIDWAIIVEKLLEFGNNRDTINREHYYSIACKLLENIKRDFDNEDLSEFGETLIKSLKHTTNSNYRSLLLTTLSEIIVQDDVPIAEELIKALYNLLDDTNINVIASILLCYKSLLVHYQQEVLEVIPSIKWFLFETMKYPCEKVSLPSTQFWVDLISSTNDLSFISNDLQEFHLTLIENLIYSDYNIHLLNNENNTTRFELYTLRKKTAVLIGVIANIIEKDDVLPQLLPVIEDKLQRQNDWKIRETGIFVLGLLKYDTYFRANLDKLIKTTSECINDDQHMWLQYTSWWTLGNMAKFILQSNNEKLIDTVFNLYIDQISTPIDQLQEALCLSLYPFLVELEKVWMPSTLPYFTLIIEKLLLCYPSYSDDILSLVDDSLTLLVKILHEKKIDTQEISQLYHHHLSVALAGNMGDKFIKAFKSLCLFSTASQYENNHFDSLMEICIKLIKSDLNQEENIQEGLRGLGFLFKSRSFENLENDKLNEILSLLPRLYKVEASKVYTIYKYLIKKVISNFNPLQQLMAKLSNKIGSQLSNPIFSKLMKKIIEKFPDQVDYLFSDEFLGAFDKQGIQQNLLLFNVIAKQYPEKIVLIITPYIEACSSFTGDKTDQQKEKRYQELLEFLKLYIVSKKRKQVMLSSIFSTLGRKFESDSSSLNPTLVQEFKNIIYKLKELYRL
ncbi:hypothetical protein CYY_007313 [Polysphondylium violaceum]|uniref:Uncharacterized protein n=1 Tax=Polysphondylium violaceum TaxID=133409 RepID=A0A8J4PPD7_9MYCE|nr:hypothetical protein CYY_007313 [Polysphondylium violaceum]